MYCGGSWWVPLRVGSLEDVLLGFSRSARHVMRFGEIDLKESMPVIS